MKLIAVASLLALLAPLPAMAQDGIPPHVAQKLGIPADKVKQVQDLTWKASEDLIGLEADLRRAQLALDRETRAATPDEVKVMALVDAVSKAEAAVRKNRISLMLRIRKIVGPETWDRLEALRHEEGHRPPQPPDRPGMPQPPDRPGMPMPPDRLDGPPHEPGR